MICFDNSNAVACACQLDRRDNTGDAGTDDYRFVGCRKRGGGCLPAAVPPIRSRERQDLFLRRVELGFLTRKLVNLDGPASKRRTDA